VRFLQTSNAIALDEVEEDEREIRGKAIANTRTSVFGY
jgi:hypothetical protein